MIQNSRLLMLLVVGGVLGGGMITLGFNSPAANGPSNSASPAATQQQSAAMDSSQSDGEMTPEPFAFFELFTSEGCSSCPSADRNLERIAAEAKSSGQNVYTLSYHVDYWDYLGWKDPYSTKEYSDRQRKYARQFESSRIYTPQMVVNGQVEFNGSSQTKSEKAITLALQAKTKSAISVKSFINDGVVYANWKVSGIGESDQIQVALVQNSGAQKVTRGENARRNLTHVNIVRKLATIADPTANKGQLRFSFPDGLSADEFHVVAFVQTPNAVTAVGKSEIGAKPAAANRNQTDRKKDMSSDSSSKKKTGENGVTVTARKPAIAQQQGRRLVSEQAFLGMLTGDLVRFNAGFQQARDNWDQSYVPILLEAARFLQPRERAQVINLVESKTGQRFGNDFDKWLQWNWKQDFKPHPGYGTFKSTLYSQIDPRFAEYFVDTKNRTIRLDEIRWGGVRRDGIPPLKNPKMLTASNASYLADSDVVFGIELNGDARAYPKRILAWHEMFKDTIGGESVCGVY